MQTIQIPEALLRKRERQLLIARNGYQWRHREILIGFGACCYLSGQASDCGCLEYMTERDLFFRKSLAYARQQLCRQKRMATQFKEIVMQSDLCNAQDMSEHPRQLFFSLRLWCDVDIAQIRPCLLGCW